MLVIINKHETLVLVRQTRHKNNMRTTKHKLGYRLILCGFLLFVLHNDGLCCLAVRLLFDRHIDETVFDPELSESVLLDWRLPEPWGFSLTSEDTFFVSLVEEEGISFLLAVFLIAFLEGFF